MTTGIFVGVLMASYVFPTGLTVVSMVAKLLYLLTFVTVAYFLLAAPVFRGRKRNTTGLEIEASELNHVA